MEQLKNYTRLARKTGRIKTFALIDSVGDPVQAFDLFVSSLVQQGLSPATVETYSNHIASFLDYLTEAQVFDVTCSQLKLMNAIKGYLPARLAAANASGDFDILSRRMLGQKRLTKATAKSHAAAINKFLFESDDYALHLQQVKEWTTTYGKLGDEALLKVMNTHYGQPTELPFDLRTRRHPVQYCLDPDASRDVIEAEREKLVGQLVGILTLYLEKPSSKQETTHAATPSAGKRGWFWAPNEVLVPRDNSYLRDDTYANLGSGLIANK